jgi:5-methylcytosine-specific restriction endonuclease McrA
MELHHKVPLSKKGSDKYDNLIWVNKKVHKLIHSTKEETVNKYIKLIPYETSLKRLNKLRVLVGNPIIK